MKWKALLAGLPLAAAAAGLTEVEEFLTATGVLVAKNEDGTFVCDKGLPYFTVGLPVAAYKGAKVENPLTGQKQFVLLKRTGRGEVVESFKTNSVIRFVEDRGVEVGNLVKLDYRRVCFVGSDLYFERLSKEVPAVKVEDPSSCRWSVVETPEGFKVLYEGRQVFFAKKELPSYSFASGGKLDLRDLRLVLKAFELVDFKQVPVGVDAASVGGRNLLAVGFPDRVELFQQVGGGLTPIGSLAVPSGTLVGLRLVTVGQKVYLLGNALTVDAEPVSFVATLVGTSPVLVQKNVPYLLGVLNDEDPEGFLFVQKFDGSFGEVYRAELTEGGVRVGKEVSVPDGFRVDAALYSADGKLYFIDPSGVLRIFKGSFEGGFEHLVDLEGNFGYSYTSIAIPGVVGEGVAGRVYFPPRPVEVQLFGFRGVLVASNELESVSSFLGDRLLKIKKGKLVFVGETGDGYFETKPFIGGSFKDSVQGFTVAPDGTPFLVSGFKNPFLFKKGGKLYRLEFRYF
ncbi:MAG: hypothetical protein GXO08_03325 [Aquificae bacterium]|nr:hypothetical protein [Aquificota bacterium]